MTQQPVVRELEKLISFKPDGILSQVVARDGGFETTLFCMAAGTAISEHTTSRAARVLVLRGRGSFTLPGGPVALGPGVFIAMPPGVTHALAATEDLAFLLFQA